MSACGYRTPSADMRASLSTRATVISMRLPSCSCRTTVSPALTGPKRGFDGSVAGVTVFIVVQPAPREANARTSTQRISRPLAVIDVLRRCTWSPSSLARQFLRGVDRTGVRGAFAGLDRG
jgi:hypothetical protein